MVSILLKKTDFDFYNSGESCFDKNCILTNIGIFYDLSNCEKLDKITHLKCLSSPEYFLKNIASVYLKNLVFFQLDSKINLEHVNFNLYPCLETLVLDITNIKSKNINNLPCTIQTLLFLDDCDYWSLLYYHDQNCLAFENLPPNLNKIIFKKLDNVGKKKYKSERKKVTELTKKFKIPFCCEIYFVAANNNNYIKRSV